MTRSRKIFPSLCLANTAYLTFRTNVTELTGCGSTQVCPPCWPSIKVHTALAKLGLMCFFSNTPTRPTYSQVNYYVLWLYHLPVGKQKSSYTGQLAHSFITKSMPSLNQLRPLSPSRSNLFKRKRLK